MTAERKQHILAQLKEWAPIVAPFVLGALILWLKSEFVTRAEYAMLSERMSKVETALLLMVEQNKQFTRLEERDHDHEQRLRALESKVR